MRSSALSIIAFALFASGCPNNTPPPIPAPGGAITRTCTVELQQAGASGFVFEWADWTVVAADDSGAATVTDAPPGEWAYAVLAPGEPKEAVIGQPQGPFSTGTLTKWVDGVEYRKVVAPNCNVPALEVVSYEIIDGEAVGKLNFLRAASDAEVGTVQVTVGPTLAVTEIDKDASTISFAVRVDPGKVTLKATAADEDGVPVERDIWLPLWNEEEPFDWQAATMYLAFTDRFRGADPANASTANVSPIADYMGGRYEGVQRAIEEGYFEALGVDALWLSPVYENPDGGFLGRDEFTRYTGYHGYWPVSYGVESSFGGDEALKSLIQTAHEYGIRVLFDIVLNHVHENHEYCTEEPSWCSKTCVCGTANCEWEGDQGRPRDCQFAPYLPDLDYRNHALVERVVADTMAQAAKFDVDGFRIDAAKHMDHVIMQTIRAETDALEAQGAAPFYLVGETFTSNRGEIMEYVNEGELHGQFDFPLFYAIRGAFAFGASFRDLEGGAAESARAYGAAGMWMSPFLGNHDIARFATDMAGNEMGPFDNTPDLIAQGPADSITQQNLIDRISMAFAFVLTQPGVPLIYYGDEIGLAGGGDPDNRRPMPAALNANQVELLSRVQALGQLRRNNPVLVSGDRKELWIDDNVYVYARNSDDGTVIVAMNKSDQSRTESVTIPTAYGLAGAALNRQLTDGTVNVVDGQIRLTIEPFSYVVLAP